MTKPFHVALSDAIDTTGISLKAACEAAHVSYEQFKKFLQRSRKGLPASTSVDDCIKLSHAFGLTIDEMVGDDTACLRSEVADLWRQLSQAEREILLAAARGQRVKQDSNQLQLLEAQTLDSTSNQTHP
ncbi:hypothetical protein [Paracoccus sp. (in: a-proteobacteria)]|uniref:hypothetical protein n=1 Tax=Paracoccus sp. TaxID=267 RepID=UPI00289AC2F4|nr:hypothetical protein [Paracoccus sp. (in: a-proteobacteria)]